jgi:hypothetical protein
LVAVVVEAVTDVVAVVVEDNTEMGRAAGKERAESEE